MSRENNILARSTPVLIQTDKENPGQDVIELTFLIRTGEGKMKRGSLIFLMAFVFCLNSAVVLAGPIAYSSSEYYVFVKGKAMESGFLEDGPYSGSSSLPPAEINTDYVDAKAVATDSEISVSTRVKAGKEEDFVNNGGHADASAHVIHEFNKCQKISFSFKWEHYASVKSYYEKYVGEICSIPPCTDIPEDFEGEAYGGLSVYLFDKTAASTIWGINEKSWVLLGENSEGNSGLVNETISLLPDHDYELNLGYGIGFCEAESYLAYSRIDAYGYAKISGIEVALSCVPLPPTISLLAACLVILLGLRKRIDAKP